ncbi:MAG: hypothetical protein KDC12_08105 [Flavobacteriales bacterium]|nr:hypothetical protein [Flavobacteriales bacterium]
MFRNVNLKDALIREKEITREQGAMRFVYQVFNLLNDEVYADHDILKRVHTRSEGKSYPNIQVALLDEERIFTLDEIRNICVKYRLRFLDAALLKSEIPHEAIAQIKTFERKHGCQIQQFRVIAPSEMFQLEDCDKDPLLFVELESGIFYLIHQWGSDMSWYRKLVMFPFRSFVSLILTIVTTSTVLSLLVPTSFVTSQSGSPGLARFAFFLWAFVSIVAVVSYVGLAFFKSTSSAQWNSPFFKQNF